MNCHTPSPPTAPSDAATPIATRRAYRAMLAEAKRVGWPLRFRSDLLKNDRDSLRTMPDAQPLLWVLRECGTCLYTISIHAIDGVGHMAWHAPEYVVDTFGADKCRFYIWDGTGLRALANAEQAAELSREIALEQTSGLPVPIGRPAALSAPSSLPGSIPVSSNVAAEFLDSALALVESQAIRDWVNVQHNRPIWETIVAGWFETLPAPIRADERHRLSAYIVCVALG